jgi:nicotinamidase/pyrazinamidase
MKALILVDLQNDLMPGGALAVPQGQAVIPLANRLQGFFKVVVATQDWHPAGHCCFAANHAGKQPGDVILLRKESQTLWPVHCVQNTRGAELATGLMLNRVNKVLRRGTAPEIDSRSAFFDAGHAQATGLNSYLQDKNVTEVYVMGLATDCEVKYTALDAVGLGFKAFLIEDACRARNLTPDSETRAIEEMKEAGVSIVSTRQILQAPTRPRQ